MGSSRWKRWRFRRAAIRVAALVALVVATAMAPAVADASTWVDGWPQIGAQAEPIAPTPHEPPVDAPVIDPFRPPPLPWLPGNRGIEYGPTTGQAVRASADGVVSFAGLVGGNLFVTVRHDDTLRTTAGFVDEVLVSAGDAVRQGQAIAIAGDTIHFTARRNGTYIDPMLLFQRFEVRVRLVE